MVKFSIIVPIYNVERFLSKCLQSIINQTYPFYEIILVNDGSTDQSGAICDEYAKLYSRVNVIHKNNGGLSDARNIGLANAKGQYIVFVDSDDFIEPESLENFYKQIEHADHPDILVTRLKKVYEDNGETKYMDRNLPSNLVGNVSKDRIVKWLFSTSNHIWPSVRYIVKRCLIEKNALKFPFGYLHEDVDWTFHLFTNANTFAVTEFYWYNHRMGRKGSITASKNVKRTLDVIELVGSNILNDGNKSNVFREVMYKRLVKSLIYTLSDYKIYSKEEKQLIIISLKRYKKVFQYTSKPIHKLFVYFCNLFGFKAGLFIMSLFNR